MPVSMHGGVNFQEKLDINDSSYCRSRTSLAIHLCILNETLLLKQESHVPVLLVS